MLKADTKRARTIGMFATLLALIICLTGSAMPALADTVSALDAAFESGEIVFRSVGLDVNWDEVEINVPERYWELLGQSPMTDEELRTALKEDEEFETLLPSAIGPDGTMLFIGTRLALRDGQLTLLCPNPELGVPDEYGFLQAYWELPPNRQISYYGVIWSPDGRYVVPIYFEDMLMESAKLPRCLDPILMDTQTGDMILLEAHEPPSKGDLADIGMVAACFSLDGRYLYVLYIDRNGKDDSRTLLKKYDIESGEMELCINTDARVFRPPLFALPDGALLIMSAAGFNRKADLFKFIPRGSNWDVEPQEIIIQGGNTVLMGYSQAAGILLKMNRCLQIIRPDGEDKGAREFWCIDKDTMLPAQISDSEINAATEGGSSAWDALYDNYNADYLNDYYALSPDGRYLLVNGGRLCIRLSDMKAVPVRLEEDYPLKEAWHFGFSTTTWHEKGLLFTGGGMGEALFALAEE